MFDDSIKRIGFCCKYLEEDQTQKPKILKEKQQHFTERTTTVAWCNRQEDKAKAEQKLFDCVEHNMQAAYNLVEYVGSLPAEMRMVRLGSNQIPMATEPTWRYVFEDKTVIKEILSFLETRPGVPSEMLAEELKRKWQIVEIPMKDYNKSVWGQLTKDERLGMSVQGFRTDTDENGNPIRIPHIGFSADLDYLDEFCSRLANKVKNL